MEQYDGDVITVSIEQTYGSRKTSQGLQFIGDALLVLFDATQRPLEDALKKAAACSLAATTIQFSHGDITFKMKVLISAGPISGLDIGDNHHREYLLMG